MAKLRSSLVDPISKKRARLRSRGVQEVVTEFTGKIRSSIRSEDELIFLSRDAVWDGVVERKTDEPLELRRATADDGRDYERFIGTDTARTFATRLSDRTDCWLVRGRGIVLHATWTTTASAWTSEIERYFVPPPASAYVYESFTRPDARGLGLYPFALVGIGRVLAADGLDRLFVGVEAGNAPSLRAIKKAGFETFFTVALRRRWGRVTIGEPSGPHADWAGNYLQTG